MQVLYYMHLAHQLNYCIPEYCAERIDFDEATFPDTGYIAKLQLAS